ncbi:hypothetical protein O9992_00195 [Vibrio lentus]|nr:hypothetical protein [Vibrio lentus]
MVRNTASNLLYAPGPEGRTVEIVMTKPSQVTKVLVLIHTPDSNAKNGSYV